MRFRPEICLTSMRRVLSGSGLAVRRHNEVICLFNKTIPANPNSEQQIATRAMMCGIGKAWRALDPEKQDRWKAAAILAAPDFPHARGRMNGYTLFSNCAANRLLAGEAAPEYPVLGRPPGVTTAVLQPTAEPRGFAFVITHSIGEYRSMYRVAVRLTPGTASAARAPNPCDARLVMGYGPQSAPPLPESGGLLEFAQARIAVQAGQRFGVWMRLIRIVDGRDSEELFLDLRRTEVLDG